MSESASKLVHSTGFKLGKTTRTISLFRNKSRASWILTNPKGLVPLCVASHTLEGRFQFLFLQQVEFGAFDICLVKYLITQVNTKTRGPIHPPIPQPFAYQTSRKASSWASNLPSSWYAILSTPGERKIYPRHATAERAVRARENHALRRLRRAGRHD